MAWLRRITIALPFAVAAALTALGGLVDRLHLSREHTAGYVFLFAAPWGWLLDHDWFGDIQSRWLSSLVLYAELLWIPAFLYSVCFWGLLHGIGLLNRRKS